MVKKSTEKFLGANLQCCLHATVLLACKYSAELNKYVLLVRVICENTGFENRKYSRTAEATRESCLFSQPVFFANKPH